MPQLTQLQNRQDSNVLRLRGSGITAITYDFNKAIQELRDRSSQSEYWRKLELELAFDRAQERLQELANLRQNWDSYDAEPPTANSIGLAERVLQLLRSTSVLPTKIVPSAEGGIGICFVDEGRYADIECLNSGEILAVTYAGIQEPCVWEVAVEDQAIQQTIERIRAHFAA